MLFDVLPICAPKKASLPMWEKKPFEYVGEIDP